MLGVVVPKPVGAATPKVVPKAFCCVCGWDCCCCPNPKAGVAAAGDGEGDPNMLLVDVAPKAKEGCAAAEELPKLPPNGCCAAT